MKHPKSIQISIPQPCSEDWNKMTPQQQGRFCDSCQKCVVDFTGFTDAQLYQFITAHQGQKVCGRFNSVQLNRQINIPPQPHSQLYKWIMAAGLTLIFTTTTEVKTFAKVPFTVQTDITGYIPTNKDYISETESDTFVVKGIVRSPDEKTLVGAYVVAIRNGVEVSQTITGIDGSFTMHLKKGAYYLGVRHPEYTFDQVIVNPAYMANNKQVELKMDFPSVGMLFIEYAKPPLIDPPQH